MCIYMHSKIISLMTHCYIPECSTYLAGSCLQGFEDCQCILQHSTHTVDPGNPAGSYMLPDHHCQGSMKMRTWWIPNTHINKYTWVFLYKSIYPHSLTTFWRNINDTSRAWIHTILTTYLYALQWSTYKNVKHQAWNHGWTLTMTIDISKSLTTVLKYLYIYPLPNTPPSYPTLHTPVLCFTWVNIPVFAKKFSHLLIVRCTERAWTRQALNIPCWVTIFIGSTLLLRYTPT